jgi:hypothetical protein
LISNRAKLEKFEKDLVAKTKPNYRKNLAIVEALYKQYIRFHGKNVANPLEGIEVKIRLAKVVNSV